MKKKIIVMCVSVILMISMSFKVWAGVIEISGSNIVIKSEQTKSSEIKNYDDLIGTYKGLYSCQGSVFEGTLEIYKIEDRKELEASFEDYSASTNVSSKFLLKLNVVKDNNEDCLLLTGYKWVLKPQNNYAFADFKGKIYGNEFAGVALWGNDAPNEMIGQKFGTFNFEKLKHQTNLPNNTINTPTNTNEVTSTNTVTPTPTNKVTSTNAVISTNKNVLPKTGEENNNFNSIIGLMIIVTTLCVILYKKKIIKS